MGFAVVCALQNDSIADPVITTPVSPIPTATTRSGANENVGRARETSHMPIAVTAPVTAGGIFSSSMCMAADLRYNATSKPKVDSVNPLTHVRRARRCRRSLRFRHSIRQLQDLSFARSPYRNLTSVTDAAQESRLAV